MEVKTVFSHWGSVLLPGFAHNCPTRLQQGRKLVLLVSFSIPASKIAHRATHGLFSFLLSLSPDLSPTGKGRLVPENALSQSSGFAHNCPTRLQQGGNPFHWCPFSLPCPQNRTQAHTGPSFGFTAFSWSALGLVVGLPTPAPTCNPSPPGWDGWRIARCCSGFFHLESVLL